MRGGGFAGALFNGANAADLKSGARCPGNLRSSRKWPAVSATGSERAGDDGLKLFFHPFAQQRQKLLIK
jgi:hypothetical protein